MSDAVMYVTLMVIVGIIAHFITKYILSFKSFRIHDEDTDI